MAVIFGDIHGGLAVTKAFLAYRAAEVHTPRVTEVSNARMQEQGRDRRRAG